MEKPIIIGYRELSRSEIDTINHVKDAAISIQALTDTLQTFPGIDKRWLSIGVTDLQKGFMAVTRAIAKPEGF